MSDVTKLTSEQIKEQLAALSAEGIVIYNKRQVLEKESLRRKTEERATLFGQMLESDSFSVDFFVQVSLRIRVPDGDWIEGNYDAETLRHDANVFNTGEMTLNGNRYRVSYPDNYIHIFPGDSRDEKSWANLLEIVGPKLGTFNTNWSLSSSDVPIALLKALPTYKVEP